MHKAKPRITSFDLRAADFGLSMDLLGKIPQDTVLKRDPGELVYFQGLPPPTSRTVYPDKQEYK